MDQSLIRDFRTLHAMPEAPGQEQKTAAFLANRLSLLGFDVQTGVCGTGVLALPRGGEAPLGLCACLSASKTSAGEWYHAWGNDAACAMILTAAARTAGLSAVCFVPAGCEQLPRLDRWVTPELTALLPAGRAARLSGGAAELDSACDRAIAALLGASASPPPNARPLSFSGPVCRLGIGAGAVLGTDDMTFRKSALELGADLLESLILSVLRK